MNALDATRRSLCRPACSGAFAMNLPAGLPARAAPASSTITPDEGGLWTDQTLLVEPRRRGKLTIAGARYDLDDGSVDFFA